MEINILIKKLEKKICDKIKCEKIIIEDKTFLHKKHKNFNSKKFHLKIKIESIELKSKKKIESNRYIFSIINEELKEYIHSIQLFINFPIELFLLLCPSLPPASVCSHLFHSSSSFLPPLFEIH